MGADVIVLDKSAVVEETQDIILLDENGQETQLVDPTKNGFSKYPKRAGSFGP